MLTRTALRASSIEILREGGPVARALLRDLSEYGLLMLPSEFFQAAPENFPQGVLIRIQEMIKEGQLPFRQTSLDFIESASAIEPWDSYSRIEVILDENLAPTPLNVECLQAQAFGDSFRVSRCRNLRNKDENLTSREDLWTWVMEPLLDGLRRSSREVTVVDKYLGLKFVKTRKGKRLKNGAPWLLSRLNENSRAQELTTRVVLVMRERPDRNSTTVSPEELRAVIASIREECQLSHLDIQAAIVPDSFFFDAASNVIEEKRDAMHDRFILFGRRRGIVLGAGIDNLNEFDHDEPLDLQMSNLNRSWQYAPAYGNTVGDFLGAVLSESLILQM